MRRILVVDDEQNMRNALSILLEKHNYAVCTACDGREAIATIDGGEVVDLIITDLKMPNVDGIGVLKYLTEKKHKIPLVLITAFGSIEAAVEAMKMGAADFITKPFNKDVICHVIDRIFQMENLNEENRHLKGILQNEKLVYKSSSMQQIINTATKIATVAAPVLITGESGVGKGLIAETIHKLGGEASRPFIAINCPTIPETLLESELFGYRRGAFTGADSDFKGKIRLSEGGTLFLDEIADIPLNVQSKLLRILEEKLFEPLGSNTTIRINNRIICATNRELKQLVDDGRFRKDLYYRINTITIEIPPLCKRPEDIIPLAEFFITHFAKQMRKEITGLSEKVRQALIHYTWPGNVRELRNVMERAVVLSQDKKIEPADLPLELREGSGVDQPQQDNKLESVEVSLLKDALNANRGNVTAAAVALGISRSTLRYRMKKYGLVRG
ncbi:MAG: sigma-54-dependent Fis family transcriptional regulator [Spirochaetaceae bacterium]|nr:MAG: sigma-54-dependent Fis family transcriptional regulator [Spirochaetaceae bacterium]